VHLNPKDQNNIHIRSHLIGNLILNIKIICFSHAVLNRAVISVRDLLLYEK